MIDVDAPERPPEQPALLAKALELLEANGMTLEALVEDGNLIAAAELRGQLGITVSVKPTVTI